MTREEIIKGLAVRSGSGKKIDCDSDVAITLNKKSIGFIFNGAMKEELLKMPKDLWVVLTDPDDTDGKIYFLFYREDDLKKLYKANGDRIGRWKLQRQGNQCAIYINSKGNKAPLNKKLRAWANRGYPIKTDFQSAVHYIDEPDCTFCELQRE